MNSILFCILPRSVHLLHIVSVCCCSAMCEMQEQVISVSCGLLPIPGASILFYSQAWSALVSIQPVVLNYMYA